MASSTVVNRAARRERLLLTICHSGAAFSSKAMQPQLQPTAQCGLISAGYRKCRRRVFQASHSLSPSSFFLLPHPLPSSLPPLPPFSTNSLSGLIAAHCALRTCTLFASAGFLRPLPPLSSFPSFLPSFLPRPHVLSPSLSLASRLCRREHCGSNGRQRRWACGQARKGKSLSADPLRRPVSVFPFARSLCCAWLPTTDPLLFPR